MFVKEQFISRLIKIHGKYPTVSTDGGTGYPKACMFLNVGHHLHFPYGKSVIESIMQYLKDRADNLMINFPAKRRNAN